MLIRSTTFHDVPRRSTTFHDEIRQGLISNPTLYNLCHGTVQGTIRQILHLKSTLMTTVTVRIGLWVCDKMKTERHRDKTSGSSQTQNCYQFLSALWFCRLFERTLPAQYIGCGHEYQNQSESNNYQSAPLPITNHIDWTQQLSSLTWCHFCRACHRVRAALRMPGLPLPWPIPWKSNSRSR